MAPAIKSIPIRYLALYRITAALPSPTRCCPAARPLMLATRALLRRLFLTSVAPALIAWWAVSSTKAPLRCKAEARRHQGGLRHRGRARLPHQDDRDRRS